MRGFGNRGENMRTSLHVVLAGAAMVALLSLASDQRSDDAAVPSRASNKGDLEQSFSDARKALREIQTHYPRPLSEECIEKTRAILFSIATSDAQRRTEAARESRRLREECYDRYFLLMAGSAYEKAATGIASTDGHVLPCRDGYEIPPPPVTVHSVADGIGVIRVPNFEWYGKCEDRFETLEHMAEYVAEQVRGMKAEEWILDLRGNLGGYADIVQHFLSATFAPASQEDIVTTKFAGGRMFSRRTFRKGVLGCPFAMLVDGRTASAAEIAGGAVRRWCPPEKMTIVGERTFGKGVALDRVVAKSFTLRYTLGEFVIGGPWNGTKVEGVGIAPDVRAASAEALRTALALLDRKRRETGTVPH